MPSHYARILKRVYKESFPDRDVRLVSAKESKDPQQQRREIIEKLGVIINPHEYVSHLVLGVHGDTALIAGKESTFLKGVGHIDSDGVSAEFRLFFSSLKNRLGSDATIVMSSCRTMCGSMESLRLRAVQIFKYFGISNGQLYGATTFEKGVAPYGLWRRVYSASALMGVALVALVAKSDVTASATAVGATAVLFGLMERMNYVQVKSINGYIFSAENGEVKEPEAVNKLIDFKKILGIIRSQNACGILDRRAISTELTP